MRANGAVARPTIRLALSHAARTTEVSFGTLRLLSLKISSNSSPPGVVLCRAAKQQPDVKGVEFRLQLQRYKVPLSRVCPKLLRDVTQVGECTGTMLELCGKCINR